VNIVFIYRNPFQESAFMATFSTDLLAIFILRFCPLFW